MQVNLRRIASLLFTSKSWELFSISPGKNPVVASQELYASVCAYQFDGLLPLLNHLMTSNTPPPVLSSIFITENLAQFNLLLQILILLTCL